MSARRKIIAGNWKMFKDPSEAAAFCRALRASYRPDSLYEMVICPPFVSIPAAADGLAGTDIAVGAQNCGWELEGAFTGEVSPRMLLTSGCKYVILGHSERRQFFSESDQLIGKKVQLALSCGLLPIVCLGEKIDEREAGRTEEVVGGQFDGVFSGIDVDGFDKCVVAYEPVWAIGTGKTATPKMAEDVHRFIRSRAALRFGEKSASAIRILYGGSMKPSNSGELMTEADIDGGLIGGASLDVESFVAIATSIRRR